MRRRSLLRCERDDLASLETATRFPASAAPARTSQDPEVRRVMSAIAFSYTGDAVPLAPNPTSAQNRSAPEISVDIR